LYIFKDFCVFSRTSVNHILARHSRGDWGECCSEDASENDFSVKAGFRIFSVYRTRNGEKLWVITEADRSVTTLLLPSEY
jgi:hypothetical protein